MRSIIAIHFLSALILRLFYALKYGKALENKIFLKKDLSSFIINLALLISIGLSLIYMISPDRIAIAQTTFPPFMWGAGILSLGLHLLLLWASHHALGPMWSGCIAIKRDHRLIRSGVYRYFRHPMYLAVVFWIAGIILVTQNFLFLGCLIMLPGLWLRIRKEEEQLRAHFSDDYPYRKGETP